jgi:hypothetical protein
MRKIEISGNVVDVINTSLHKIDVTFWKKVSQHLDFVKKSCYFYRHETKRPFHRPIPSRQHVLLYVLRCLDSIGTFGALTHAALCKQEPTVQVGSFFYIYQE